MGKALLVVGLISLTVIKCNKQPKLDKSQRAAANSAFMKKDWHKKLYWDDANKRKNPANVQRIMKILTPTKWKYLFPKRLKDYHYKYFIRAVARFPRFCNEKGSTETATKDHVCKRELATLFAHFTQETGDHNQWMEDHEGIAQWRQGLTIMHEGKCKKKIEDCYGYNDSCDTGNSAIWYKCGTTAFNNSIVYYGRGPFQISHNYNYGAFSHQAYGAQKILLNAPNYVSALGD